jgi:hypothetical protein
MNTALICFGIGIVIGAAGGGAIAFALGWRNLKLTAKVELEEIAPAIAAAAIQAAQHANAQVRPVNNITVGWEIINAAVQGSGYMLIAKPKDADDLVKHN